MKIQIIAGSELLIAVLVGIVLLFVIAFWRKRDSTDNPNGARSGLRLHVDHETGVNYLSGPEGGVTPRLRADGTIYVSHEKR